MKDVADLRAHLAGQEESILRLERSLRQLELDVAARNARLEELQDQLTRIGSSLEWRLISRLGRIARSLAPPDSRRRAWLKRIHRLSRRASTSPIAVANQTVPEVSTAASTPRLSHLEDDDQYRNRSANARSHRADLAHEERSIRTAEAGSLPRQAVRGGRVLIVDHRLPSPDRDCGSLRMVEMIRIILNRGHSVCFIPDNFLVWPPYFEQLRSMGAEVVHPPLHNTVADYLRECGDTFDLAIISRAGIAAKHLGTVRWLAPGARVAFDTVDLHFIREQGEADLTQDSARHAAVAQRRDQELGLASRSDVTIVVSEEEERILRRECPGVEVMVIPTIYPVDPAPPPVFDDRGDIVFIGGFAHAPNVDAVLHFVRDIFPLVESRLPGVVLKVVGPEPPPEILALVSERVQILGFVADVKPVFDQALASVAPLRFGAGVKGKVNHSMAMGVPAIVTSLAASGMYLTHEHDAMICDDPASFATALVRVCQDRQLWERLSVNGRRNLREHFSIEAATGPIDRLLAWAGLTGAGGQPIRDRGHASPIQAS